MLQIQSFIEIDESKQEWVWRISFWACASAFGGAPGALLQFLPCGQKISASPPQAEMVLFSSISCLPEDFSGIFTEAIPGLFRLLIVLPRRFFQTGEGNSPPYP
jgi:hypothetical protein